MAYAIKKPWILSTLLSQLNSDQRCHTTYHSHSSKENHDNVAAKSEYEWKKPIYGASIENPCIKYHWKIPRIEFVQLLKVINCPTLFNHENALNNNTNDTHGIQSIMATISDRKHSIKALFTPECLDDFRKAHPNRRSFIELEGAILCLSEGSFKFDGLSNEVIIQINRFHFIGADGTAVFDIPEPIQNSHELQELLSNWLSFGIVSSATTTTQLGMDMNQQQHYTQALDIQLPGESTNETAFQPPIDKILDRMCSESFVVPSKMTSSYVSWHLEDVTLTDCIIPADQQLILDSHDSWASIITDVMPMEDTNEIRTTGPINEISKGQALLYRQIFGEQSPIQLVDEELHSLEEEPNPSTPSTEIITCHPSETVCTQIESIHITHQAAMSSQTMLSTTINSTTPIEKFPTIAPIIETTTPLLFSDGSKKESHLLSNSRSVVSAISPWSHLLNGISTTTSFHLTTTPNKDITLHQHELDPMQLLPTSNPLSPESPSVSHDTPSPSISSSSLSRKRAFSSPHESDLLSPISSRHSSFLFLQTQKSFDWLPEYYQQRYHNYLLSLNHDHYYPNVRSW
jgi:hypothetical protein